MASLPLPGNCRDDIVLDTCINVDGFPIAKYQMFTLAQMT